MANEPVKTGGFTLPASEVNNALLTAAATVGLPGRKWRRRTDVLDWSGRDSRRGKHRLKSVESLSGLLMAVLRPECGGCERVHPPPGSA